MIVDWPIKTLDDVCEKITDGAHNSPKSVAIGKPMASVKDLTRFGVELKEARHISIEDFDKLVRQGCKPEIGDVLIAKDGNSALDTVCNVKQPLDAVLLSSVAILRPDPKRIDSDFLKYYFTSQDTINYLKSNFISGAAIPRVVLKDFRKAQIKLPPLEDQVKISAVLGSLDDKIALNRQINQTLEQMAQAIFKSWFVDFQPVKAKIGAKQNGQNPERAAIRTLSGKTDEELNQLPLDQLAQLTATTALFPDELVDSGLGLIPKGWEIKSVEDLSTIVAMGPFGSNIKVSTFVDEGVPVISGKHLNGTLLEDCEFNYVTESHAERLKKSVVYRGDVIFTHAGNIGQVAYIPDKSRYEKYVLSQRQFYMRPDSDQISSLFIVQYFKSHIGQHNLLANTSQVGVPSISRPVSYLRTIELVVPSKELSDSYDAIVRSLHSGYSNNIDQSKNLIALRDTLLPKLLSGEITVTEAKQTAKAVA